MTSKNTGCNRNMNTCTNSLSLPLSHTYTDTHLALPGITPWGPSSSPVCGLTRLACHHSSSLAFTTCKMSPSWKLRPSPGRLGSFVLSYWNWALLEKKRDNKQLFCRGMESSGRIQTRATSQPSPPWSLQRPPQQEASQRQTEKSGREIERWFKTITILCTAARQTKLTSRRGSSWLRSSAFPQDWQLEATHESPGFSAQTSHILKNSNSACVREKMRVHPP